MIRMTRSLDKVEEIIIFKEAEIVNNLQQSNQQVAVP